MELDSVLIARLQFAFTIIWHIIFPAFTIGLAAYVATLCVMWMRTGKEHYRELARFWTKIFAAAFAMGVVSGLVLTYQFGTNWSRYSAVLGNVVGPMIEVAFFLEATFLGVLLFGWDRMPPWLHAPSAVAVAGGTLMSAFWILSANSWMQTPVGFEMRDGVAYPLDWLDIVFSPSFPYRLAHMVMATYLTTSFVVLAVGARYILAGEHLEHGHTMVRMAVAFAAGGTMRNRTLRLSKTRAVLINSLSAIATLSLASSAALAAGDRAAGQQFFTTHCSPCHATQPGVNKIGPSLVGVVGRKSGSKPGYNYSPALKAANITWDEKTLDQWLQNPTGDVHGSKMFITVPNAEDRQNVIAYLETLK